MEPQVQSGIKTWQWIVTAIIIIVIIIVGFMVFSNKNAESIPNVVDNTVTNTVPVANISRIIMTDQYPGNVVFVSSVQTTSGAWVVIQKDLNGKPGAVIGSSYAAAGTVPVKVTLTEPMIDGSLYYAVLYSGSSSDKTFSQSVNAAITDASGSVVMKPFHATASASLEVKG